MSNLFDIAVIGGGIAGLTAAHHAAQGGAEVAHIIGLEPAGGLVANVGVLSGFPCPGTALSGIDLALSQSAANRALGVTEFADHCTALTPEAKRFRITCGERELSVGQVIVATGARLRMLDVPGASQLVGRGVSQCGWCDGALHKGQDIVVVGGGDAAIEEALHLAQFASHLTIVTRGDGFRARQSYINRIAEHDNVSFRWMSDVLEIIGTESDGAADNLASTGVTAVRIFSREENTTEEIPCSGVFVFIGTEPNTQRVAGHATLDPRGAIITDADFQTSTPGLFAAGAVRSGYHGRLVHAAADAASAAIAAVARQDAIAG